MTDKTKIGNNIYLWLTMLVAWTVLINLVKIDNPDIWFHLQLGNTLMEKWSAPDYSLFYFSPVKETVNDLRFTWLGDITLALVHQAGGEIGLQLFGLFVICLTCYLVFALFGKGMNAWNLLTLMMVVLGTFQLQAIRNSMFAMPFIVLIFYLWRKIDYLDKPLWVWAYPLVLGVWSCMHGSYLLGFTIVCLLLAGDLVDTLRLTKSFHYRKMAIYLGVLVLSFGVISFKNPMTHAYFNTWQIKRLFSVFISMPDRAPQPQASTIETPLTSEGSVDGGKMNPAGFLRHVKSALNNTIVETRGKTIISSEYLSPFDALNKPYVLVALAMGGMTLLAFLFWIRPVRCALLFPWLFVLTLGLGYLRTVGYIPIVAAAVLFLAFGRREVKWRVSGQWVNVIPPVLLVLILFNLMSGYRAPLGQGGESFGFGKALVFSDHCPDRIFNEYRKNNLFTTTMNGSYLLHRWYPHKKVFWDAFFSPHAGDVFSDFTRMHFYEKVDPDFIVKKYGIDTAAVEFSNGGLNKTFLYGENWYPRFMDQGMIFYTHQPDYQGRIPSPEILLTPGEWRSLPDGVRKNLAQYAYRIAACHIRKGRIADTIVYFNKNRDLFAEMDHDIDPGSKMEVINLLEFYKSAYGDVNTKSIYYEWNFDECKAKGDMEKAVENGLKVIAAKPDAYPMLLELAIIFNNRGEFGKSLDMVKKVLPAKEKNREFWENNRKGISILLLNLFPEEMITNEGGTAYALLHEAYLADPSPSTREQSLDQGMKLYVRLRESGEVLGSFKTLSAMMADFPQEGKLYNEVALHIIIHGEKIGKKLTEALPVSLKAIELMEKRRDPLIDGAYYTLSELYFRLGDFKSMRFYEEKALESAPADRKKKYSRRELKEKDHPKDRING